MKENSSASIVATAEKGSDEVVIEVGEGEETCRVCHLSREIGCSTKGSEMIRIGCECRGELGFAHRDCGEAWFRVRGNRSNTLARLRSPRGGIIHATSDCIDSSFHHSMYCEICGMHAKNITGQGDLNFMEEWHEGRMLDCSHDEHLTHRVIFWRSRPFCNFLMGCLIIAFIFPWFFRVLF